MPLKEGTSQAVIGENIGKEIRTLKKKSPDATDGEIKDQAVAIALTKAGVSKKNSIQGLAKKYMSKESLPKKQA